MAIVFKLLKGGAFVAGDTETKRTAYAYPSSPHATQANERAAREMMRTENAMGPTRDQGAGLADYDARNWERLNA